MKRRVGLFMTLVISALLVLSTFGAIVLNAGETKEEASLVLVKDVFDGENWVNEIDANPGDTVSFRITITYYNVTDPEHTHYATYILVNDTLPDCFEYETGSAQPSEPSVSGNLLMWDLGSTKLYHEESYVITFNASIDEEGCTGERINEAEAEADEICTGQHIFDDDTAIVNVVEPSNPDIDVEKYVSIDGCMWYEEVHAYYCTDVIFKIVVENTGDVALSVYVNDTLPDCLEYNGSATVNDEPLEPNFVDDIFYWYFDEVEVDEVITIKFNAHVIGDPCVENINLVEVTGITEFGQVVEDDDTAIVIVNGMCIKKEVWDEDEQEWVEETEAAVDDIVRFKITITYYGDLVLKDIQVEDQLPECLKYGDNAVPEEPEISGDGKTLWWNLSSEYNLQDGESLEIEFDAIVNETTCEPCLNWVYVTAWECGIEELYGEDSATLIIICDLTADAGGPYYGEVDEEIEIEGTAKGGVKPYDYSWDLDEDGEYDDATGESITHSWDAPGTYIIWLKVVDDHDNVDTDYASVFVGLDNEPPNKPSVSGTTLGVPGTKYNYTISAIDPDGDQVYYWIDWDDGNVEEWIGPFDSGDPQIESHIFLGIGKFTIKVKAKDVWNEESELATLTVTMPRSRTIYSPFLNFLKSHPNLFPIIQRIIQRLGLF